MVSLESGKSIILCKITLLSDPVTYGTLEVMVDWHCSKCVQACPNCIGWDLDWPRCYSCNMACTIIGLISMDTYLGECSCAGPAVLLSN